MIRTLKFFICLSLAFLPILASAQKEVPELSGKRVHDDAKVLSSSTVDYLERRLKSFEDSTTNQIAILIIPSLQGEVLELYSIRVAEKWKLGTKNNDNGAILIIAIEDRKIRIETGQGLEGVLTDALCNRIIRNQIAPAFRKNDYDEGVSGATIAIMQAIRGEYKAEDVTPSRGRRGGHGYLTFIIIVLFVLFRVFIFKGRSGGGWYIGGGGGGWSGGGGGGGGFSGGGGSFGGGGSSGSW